MQEDILTIDGIQYSHSDLVRLSKQSPTIDLLPADISIAGITINEESISKETDFVVNKTYCDSEIIVLKHFNKFVLLAGFDKYLTKFESGNKRFKAKLISKPVIKKARMVTFIKPKVVPKDTYRSRRKPHFDILPEEDLSTTKPSRARKIG